MVSAIPPVGMCIERTGIQYALKHGLACDGIKVIVVTGVKEASADKQPNIYVENMGAKL